MNNPASDSSKYNAILNANVSNIEYTNPKPQDVYHLVVVGAGSAGLVSAAIAAGLGAKVALIEKEHMGGDCLNSGCVPSKALIASSRLAKEMKKASVFGLESFSHNAEKDFSNIMEDLRRIRSEISFHDSKKRYTEMGVDVFFGNAQFIDEHHISIDDIKIKFAKAIIATGARAVHVPINGLEKNDYYTNETIFELNILPKHMLFIGGGPIGCELAQAFSRLGTKVSIVQRGKFLPREDQDASKILAEVFEEEGIEVLLDAELIKVEKLEGSNKKAFIKKADGSEIELDIDAVFLGIGRAPNVENLGLENANVVYDKRKGIIVDDYLRTSSADIFAAGDCCMLWKFTHAADKAAQIAVQNALFFGKKKLSAVIMPWCTYTEPEIAHVGMYEYDAKEKGQAVDFYTFYMKDVDRAKADRKERGFVKFMTKKGSDKILGATIVASHAGDMISEITTAMQGKMGLSKLSDVIHPYPTNASAIQRAAVLYKKSKLTPSVAKGLKFLLDFNLKRTMKKLEK